MLYEGDVVNEEAFLAWAGEKEHADEEERKYLELVRGGRGGGGHRPREVGGEGRGLTRWLLRRLSMVSQAGPHEVLWWQHGSCYIRLLGVVVQRCRCCMLHVFWLLTAPHPIWPCCHPSCPPHAQAKPFLEWLKTADEEEEDSEEED
jgi:hypothetical protein